VWQLGYLQGTSLQPDVSGSVVHFIIEASSGHVKQCCFGESLPVMKLLSREHAMPSSFSCWSLSLHAEIETTAAATRRNEMTLRMGFGYHLIRT